MRTDRPDDPLRILGLPASATAEEIRGARRELAKSLHPDVGGTVAGMREVNDAAAVALRAITASAVEADSRSGPPAGKTAADDSASDSADDSAGDSVETEWTTNDIPSFVVEALPAETFEALLVVASWLGDVIEDDPPYRLEVHLRDPFECWCRLDLVPDAGASTVSLTVARYGTAAAPPVELVRDVWIDQLNRYDW